MNTGGLIGVPELPVFSHAAANGIRVSHVARIDLNLISVVSEVDEFRNEFLSEICKGATELIRTAVDMVSFASGWAWNPQLDFVVLPDGSMVSLLFGMQDLAGICTAYKLNSTDPKDAEEFRKMFATALTYPSLALALNDLIQASAVFHVAPQNCGRVIDALRRMLAPPNEPDDSNRTATWPLLRQAIRADKAYLDFITKLSTGPRHGDRTHIPETEVTECLKRTWITMNRFMEYFKRGCQNLPEDEFPELKG